MQKKGAGSYASLCSAAIALPPEHTGEFEIRKQGSGRAAKHLPLNKRWQNICRSTRWFSKENHLVR
ncbi:MAG: hypothetical protein LBE79_02835 [Tannerella sp.]|jgi:hypothetical protein|nr:hypothetical protein [Tannerella sp.]